jgi:chemotaxis protein MotB
LNELAADQQRALAQLAEWQKSQQREMDLVAQERSQGQLRDAQLQAETIQRQQQELEELADFRRRALELDTDNRELHAQLAQLQQRNRLLEDQSQLLQQQLNDTAQQLARAAEQQQQADQRVMMVQQEADKRVSALQATIPQQATATIRANSSLRQSLTPIAIAGVSVRQDGDVIRIELPTDTIFGTGTASMNPQSTSLIDQVATAIRQAYARQMIGIEAHADAVSAPGAGWQSAHQLTAAQAMAIFDQFVQRHGFDSRQLFVLGHGGNHPIASNATAAGQQRNRRVEVVIYPEVMGEDGR